MKIWRDSQLEIQSSCSKKPTSLEKPNYFSLNIGCNFSIEEEILFFTEETELLFLKNPLAFLDRKPSHTYFLEKITSRSSIESVLYRIKYFILYRKAIWQSLDCPFGSSIEQHLVLLWKKVGSAIAKCLLQGRNQVTFSSIKGQRLFFVYGPKVFFHNIPQGSLL